MYRWLAPALLLAVVAAGCGAPVAEQGPEDPAASELDAAEPEANDLEAEDADPADTDEPAQPAVRLDAASTELGEVLVDSDGMTVYLFDLDEAGESACYDECAVNWPPVEGPAEAGEGVDPDLIGTTERTDGTVQATYAGWPLYTFVGDGARGDVAGQGVNDVWWVIAPDGARLTGSDDAGGGGYGY